MSSSADTTAKLSSRFPDASAFTGLVDKLKAGVGGVTTPGLPTDKIQSLAGSLSLQLPDTSNWHTAIHPDATSLVSNFPDASTLTQPIMGPVGTVRDFLSKDFAGAAASVASNLAPQLPSDGDIQSFIEFGAQPVGILAKMLQDPELTQILSAISSLTGASRITELPQQVGTVAGQIRSVLQDKVEGPIIGFLSLISAITTLEQLGERISNATKPFSLDQTQARLQGVLDGYGAGAEGLAQKIGALGAASQDAAAAVVTEANSVVAAYQSFLSSLSRDMALTEVGLALFGVTDLQQQFQQIDMAASKVNWAASGSALADWLHGEIQKAADKLKIDPGFTIDELKQQAHTGIALVTEEIDKLDPAKLVGGIQSEFQTILAPFHKLEDFKTQVETIVRGALQTIRDAIEKIDIKAVKDTVQQALTVLKNTLGDVAKVFDQVRSTVQSALDTVKTALDGVKTFVLDPQNGLKKKIEDVFQTVKGVLETLNVEAVVNEVKSTLQPISDALAKIEFQPVIDAIVQAINAITDVLKTVTPLLVTDALKQKLAAAASFLNQIDFNQIGTALTGTFGEILASVDQDALGAFKDEYQQVVASIKNFDPVPALEDVQTSIFDPLVSDLEKLHPGDLLKPVNDAFQQAASALDGFKPADTFGFMTSFFQKLEAQFEKISPAQLLAPVEQMLDDLRTKIRAALHLDFITAALTQLKGWLQPIINAIDFDPILEQMSAGWGQMKAAMDAFDPAILSKYAAKMVSSIFSAVSVVASATGLSTLFDLLHSGAQDLTQKLDELKTQLDTAGTQVAQFDAASALTALRLKFNEMQTAAAGVVSPPPGLSDTVNALDPMATLAPLLPKIQRVQTAFAAQVSAFDGITAPFRSTLQILGGPLNFLRTLISPAALLRDLLLAPFRGLFPDKNFSSVKELLTYFMDQFDPGEFRADMTPLFAKVRTKLTALADDTVLNPISDLVQSINGAVDLLDIHSLVDAINQPFHDVENVIKSLDPTPIIQEIDQDYQQVLKTLQDLNPAAFINEISNIYQNDIVEVIQQISPKDMLLPPLRQLFQEISGLLGAFDIEAIFKPVLDRLKKLDGDLGDGLHTVEGVYSQMLTVLASASGRSASVSVSAQAA